MADARTALVTGATRGIGAAILEALGDAGLRVVGTATTEAGATRIEAALSARGHEGGAVCLDVSSPDSVSAALGTVRERFGPPLVLVNNAGITRDQLLLRMGEADVDAVLDTNLKGVFRLSKGVLRGMMKARFGRIVSITSVIGTIGNAGQANYAAAKAGIGGFTRSLAREVGSRDITVNAVAPGFIDTDMTRELGDDQRDSLLGQIPLGRLGQAADVAAAVAFLVSDAAAYITGQTIHVNGGMHMG